ncbi:GGDEF domain-containing protein [Thioalkalivibrio sp. ALE21]|uniref:GGDEF domain-containing protein n=1 Tax=Thioalkalivibrio sp. ALE21 TaxID=1158175 RepID=UPI000DA1167E|nr:GGDEF domain-containing protein [Thioalkalivibrio sp. ALE21]
MADHRGYMTHGHLPVPLPRPSPWTAAFADDALEARFRSERSRGMRVTFLVVLALILAMLAALVPLDLAQLEGGWLEVAFVLRGVFAAMLLGAALSVWRWPEGLLTIAPLTGLGVALLTLALTFVHGLEHSSPVLDTSQFAFVGMVFVLLLPNTGRWRWGLTGVLLLATWAVALGKTDDVQGSEAHLAGLFVSFVLLVLLAIAHREDVLRHWQFAALDRLVRMSTTDPLTGVANRRGFFDAAEAARHRALLEEEPLTVVLLDLDHFKGVNDRHGHAVGDEVLRSVARVLRDTLKPGETLARLGGEEFGVLLPGMSLEQAEKRAQGLRSEVQALCVQSGSAVVRMTASVGVAAWMPEESIDAALGRADLGMYEAKSAGRNCVRAAAGDAARPMAN